MLRVVGRLLLALAVGFLVYRVALATVASPPFVTAPLPCAEGASPPHFDALTGFPIGWSCQVSATEAVVYPPMPLLGHWARSSWTGLAAAGLALLLLWWPGRGARRGASRHAPIRQSPG